MFLSIQHNNFEAILNFLYLGFKCHLPMLWSPVCGGGWLDQVGMRLTLLSTGLKVEAELGNCKKKFKIKKWASN